MHESKPVSNQHLLHAIYVFIASTKSYVHYFAKVLSHSLFLHVLLPRSQTCNILKWFEQQCSKDFQGVSMFLFGHWLLFHSFLVPDHFYRDIFCFLSCLTRTYDSSKHRKTRNSRDKPVLFIDITDNFAKHQFL